MVPIIMATHHNKSTYLVLGACGKQHYLYGISYIVSKYYWKGIDDQYTLSKINSRKGKN